MYAKIFAQIYDGTLCTNHPWQALVTFQQLLVLADQEGNVDMTARAISRRTGIPLEIIELGIAELLLPDPESRTPDEGGRRIMPLVEGRDWGWRVVNYVAYRSLKREEDRREYHRRYYQQNRSAASRSTKNVENVEEVCIQPIAEANAEANAEAPKVKSRCVATASRLPADWQPSEADIAYCNKERPELKVDRVAENFRDYWHAKAGEGARKVNWSATWRTWVRNEKDMRQPPVSQFKSEKQRNMEASMKAIYGPKAPAQTEKLITGEIV